MIHTPTKPAICQLSVTRDLSPRIRNQAAKISYNCSVLSANGSQCHRIAGRQEIDDRTRSCSRHDGEDRVFSGYIFNIIMVGSHAPSLWIFVKKTLGLWLRSIDAKS